MEDHKRNLINGYYLLEQDLKEILLFVEPDEEVNYNTYSHRLYALFIRACTEFEANCKDILKEERQEIFQNMNINSYYKIHDFYESINNFQIKLHLSKEIDLKPLFDWEEQRGPIWYQQFNDVKHARVTEFKKATFKNVLYSVASVYILLYARFGNSVMCQYQENDQWYSDDEFVWKENSLFKIKPELSSRQKEIIGILDTGDFNVHDIQGKLFKCPSGQILEHELKVLTRYGRIHLKEKEKLYSHC